MLTLDVEREADGRWIAEVPALSGVPAHGVSPEQARAKVKTLTLRVVAASQSMTHAIGISL
ncbi:hypothetical protein RA307_02040 [Xanthobacteraceae bacterium Astr-EGSB]|uniref:type II toxin-antitoxin system HicB family antitoxin n=1 Tax=Astrobacterium formosum TaxID=3069710 RepID=UPI0027AFEF64|nr:hypothetical protein [Xanthobacteraceae bacterium Astr-EGSB]